jgi:hypothetical protein
VHQRIPLFRFDGSTSNQTGGQPSAVVFTPNEILVAVAPMARFPSDYCTPVKRLWRICRAFAVNASLPFAFPTSVHISTEHLDAWPSSGPTLRIALQALPLTGGTRRSTAREGLTSGLALLAQAARWCR